MLFMGPGVDLDQRLPGQRVIVTGASYGIGEEIALRYCAHGARVVLTARSERMERKKQHLQDLVAQQVSFKQTHYRQPYQ